MKIFSGQLAYYSVMIAFLILASCGDENSGSVVTSGTSPVESSFAQEVNCSSGVITQTVDVRNNAFNPAVLSIIVGDIIKWENFEDVQHTVTSGTPGFPEIKFDLTLTPQTTESREKCLRFLERGKYLYFDRQNNNMTGQIIVR